MKKLLSVILFILVALHNASAEDFYVKTGGSDSFVVNSSCDGPNYMSLTWLNAASSWSSTKTTHKIGPGDTVHLCGTLTCAAGATGITINASGSSGSPITIKFEDGAILEAPYFVKAIYSNGKSYINVDGGKNGIIRHTDSGDFLTYKRKTSGISIGGAIGVAITDIEVKNLTLTNLYVVKKLLGTSAQRKKIGTGIFTFTDVPAGMDWAAPANQNVIIVPASTCNSGRTDFATFMKGTIKSYYGTTVVVDITSTAGSGSYSAWHITTYDPTGGFWCGCGHSCYGGLVPNGASAIGVDASNTKIHHNTITYSGGGISWGSYNFSHVEIYNNTTNHVGQGIVFGSFWDYGMDDVKIHDNVIANLSPWNYNDGIKGYGGLYQTILAACKRRGYPMACCDGPGTGANCHEGLCSNIQVYNNRIGPGFGGASGAIYINHGWLPGMKIYNNVLIGNEIEGSPYITVGCSYAPPAGVGIHPEVQCRGVAKPYPCCTGVGTGNCNCGSEIYNNTIYSTTYDRGAPFYMHDGASNTVIKNNLVVMPNLTNGNLGPYSLNATASIWKADNNVFYMTSISGGAKFPGGSFSQWQQTTGNDTNSNQNNPHLDRVTLIGTQPKLGLTASSTNAINKGADLSPAAVNLQCTDLNTPIYCCTGYQTGTCGIPSLDLEGTVRPQGAAWDIGAYEYTTDVAVPRKVDR